MTDCAAITGDAPADSTAGGLVLRIVKSRRRRKTLSLSVLDETTVLIQAPHHTSKEYIHRFFEEKKEWVLRKIRETRERRELHKPRSFAEGEVLPFLGKPCTVRIVDRAFLGLPLVREGDSLLLLAEHRVSARDLIEALYKREAVSHFSERLRFFSERCGLAPARMRVKDARRTWGSCTHDNRISFNWRLIMAPEPVIDYIVVHELGHIRFKDHSRKFWDFVQSVIPEYKAHRRWLKDNDHMLRF